jgi:hypothetical protein
LTGSGLTGSGLIGSGLTGSGLIGSGLIGSGLIGCVTWATVTVAGIFTGWDVDTAKVDVFGRVLTGKIFRLPVMVIVLGYLPSTALAFNFSFMIT